MREDRKIIFLDIDGVLNSHLFDLKSSFIDSDNPQIDPSTIELLNDILLEDKSIFIIISSSWSESKTLTELRQLLEKNGLIPNRVCGKINYRKGKRESIHDVIEKFNLKTFCVIDDDWLFNLNDFCQKYFIKTSFHEGLKEKHINIIRELFRI